ncbi:MAG TPA: glycine zipper 2TM domain-containing protein [Desulfobacter sp.]|jgi:outer membrane lipoprotein SlyB|nr:glycine zipper 2TM domain-containing protein [Desulfobacteraceae bacterium]HKL83155.1 glycine zipper 2TM domain-containing protein [Desulfobacter sp.]
MNTAGSGIKLIVCIMAAAMMTMAGCASSSSNVYTHEQTMQAQTVDTGTVESVKSIIIQASNPPVAGGAIGGVTGGVLGSTIGHGHGRDLATIGGALAGAAIGAVIEQEAGTKNGFEIVVNLDSGRTIVVVQEADVPMFPGDRVRVLTAPDGTTRVSK